MKVGKPLTISSGFRCKTYNSTLPNSAKKSKHIQGCALDINTSNLHAIEKYIFVEEAIRFGLRIGIYASHIHIDYSPDMPKALWYGTY